MNEKNEHQPCQATTVLEAAALCLLSSPVVASVITGTVDLPVPQTSQRIYFNIVTRQNSTIASNVAGWDFNPFGTSKISFFWSGSSTTTYAAGAATGGTALNLAPGDVVGSSLIYAQGVLAGTNFQDTGYGYVGVKFTNESTGALNYGYVEMRTKAPSGLGSKIMAYAYENSGHPIAVESIEGIFLNSFE